MCWFCLYVNFLVCMWHLIRLTAFECVICMTINKAAIVCPVKLKAVQHYCMYMVSLSALQWNNNWVHFENPVSINRTPCTIFDI